jgi:hypothetical protein
MSVNKHQSDLHERPLVPARGRVQNRSEPFLIRFLDRPTVPRSHAGLLRYTLKRSLGNRAMASGQSERIAPPLQLHGLAATGRNWDATKSEAPAELLQLGFELAHFLVPDRSSALAILIRALEKLRVRSRRELKRLYWRDKHIERPIRRIARGDVDMLQWLIMFEAEQDERAQERVGAVSAVGMVIRYIKHLVQITTGLSSFYVNIGLTRVLHNYSTSEAQRVYERLTSRYLGADEYRRAKSALMDKISERFTGFVKIARVDHGELRFETSDQQQELAEVTAECLKAFTPWSTRASCAQFISANGGGIKLKSPYQDAKADQNEIELRCCHILIEPTCCGQLMEDLAFDPPETKLALPRFFMPEKQEKNGDNNAQPPHPPELSQEDIDQIQRRLAMTDARRRTINPRMVKILIDGVEHTQIDLTQKSQVQIALEMGANLIEVRGEDERGELLLATHVISYANDAFDYSGAIATLSSGKLKFEVTPIATLGQGPPRAILVLAFQPRLRWTRPWLAWREFAGGRPTIRAYVLAGLAMALLGAGVTGAVYSYKLRALEQKLQQAQRSQQLLLPTSARAIISYRLVRDDQRVRGSGTVPIPEISLRLHSAAISLELPLGQSTRAESYSAELKAFTGDQTLMAQNILRPVRSDGGETVQIIVPADLLKADSYYTVHLHSSDRTDHFTFKVVDKR